MKVELDTLEGKFDTLKVELDTLEGKFDTLKVEFDILKGNFEPWRGKVEPSGNRSGFREIFLSS